MTVECYSADSKTNVEERDHKKPSKTAPKCVNTISVRPNASSGNWLCCLIPMAFVFSYIKYQYILSSPVNLSSKCTGIVSRPHYKTLTAASVGLFLQTVCLFQTFTQKSYFLRASLALVPGLSTALLFVWFLKQKLWMAGFWGFGVTFFYQKLYILIMHGFPKSFSYGEGSVLIQGLSLFLINCVMHLPNVLQKSHGEGGDFDHINIIMMSALLFIFFACGLLVYVKALRSSLGFYCLLSVLLTAITCAPVVEPVPIVWMCNFLFSEARRIMFIVFYLSLVGATVWAVVWQTSNNKKSSTRMRKVFHVMVVLVYVPGLLRECTLLYAASGVAFALLTILELFRLLDIPPLGNVLKRAMTSFVDEKDAGMLAVTPFCLLIGVSLPLWINPCVCSSNTDRALDENIIQLLSGVLTVGIGDTAASVIGSIFGRMKWINSTRSLEGTIAYVVSVSFTLFVLHFSGHAYLPFLKWLNVCVAIFVTSLLEAFTDQIDNLVLPLVFYIATNFA